MTLLPRAIAAAAAAGAAAPTSGAAVDAAAPWRPFAGIVRDVRARLPHYRSDFALGANGGGGSGTAAGRWRRLAAAAVYIFLASFLPAVAFGQQLADATRGRLAVAHVLLATAVGGIAQALLGGQPLLIVGVAEPIVLIYGFWCAPAVCSLLPLASCGWWFALLKSQDNAPRKQPPTLATTTTFRTQLRVRRRPAGPRRGALPAVDGVGLRLDRGARAAARRLQRVRAYPLIHALQRRAVWRADRGAVPAGRRQGERDDADGR